MSSGTWGKIDFRRRMLTVERSDYKWQVTLPKHDKIRQVPMTERLTRALLAHRHLQGPRVLYLDGPAPYTMATLRHQLEVVCRTAGLRFRSPHALRHSFCSHLAMLGAPALSIRELAGHRDLTTTQRYMHLTPAALEGAISLLERPAPASTSADRGRGENVETDRDASEEESKKLVM